MLYKFGKKLRVVRERKKLTMKEVAQKAEVSESLVSQIERNKVSPAIDTLLKIADVLDIDYEFLFSDYKKTKKVNIIRNDQRNRIILDGVTYEQLSKSVDLPEKYGIEAFYIEIEPGLSKGSKKYGHQGTELGFIIEGEGQLQFGKEHYSLFKGDSVSFASDVPHNLINSGKTILKAFWVITPPKMFIEKI